MIVRLALPIAWLLAPAAASAHLQSGFGPFYDGLLHPLVTFEDLLPLLALAIWAGLRGAGHARWLVIALPVCWLAGLLVGDVATPGRTALAAGIVLGLIVSVGGAANLPAPRIVLLVLGAAIGVLHGAAGAADGGFAPLAMVGLLVTVCGLFTIVAGQIVALRIEWTRIAARVLASWTAAAGLLQLGWMFRPG